jgi:hypothetical protein
MMCRQSSAVGLLNCPSPRRRPRGDCGVGYVPAAEYAAKAVAEKSNRAIAAELGLGLGTVQRARIRHGTT